MTLSWLLCLAVSMFATTSVVLGQGNGNGDNGGGTNSPNQLVITTATIDSLSTTITITGQNFGDTPPDAFLGLSNGGVVDLLNESTPTPTEFLADLPTGILPGNYLLRRSES